jgi:hypothetical protein
MGVLFQTLLSYFLSWTAFERNWVRRLTRFAIIKMANFSLRLVTNLYICLVF